jgi:hypothetical protein
LAKLPENNANIALSGQNGLLIDGYIPTHRGEHMPKNWENFEEIARRVQGQLSPMARVTRNEKKVKAVYRINVISQ